ncbi:complex III assembly factor LYRM7 [Vanessa tameamea]|uniref:Complex III assembly factor LYRM7 n=1 Tax=Vanessa tameamea TaxID=334116 RepID=A0A8B8IJV1_VANTA|nr:complex III assembly factor LYRM7 [Vanessa tameamea]XP_026496652.1 complex III assembly factor LYRM7 [Vanessa tameamea]
MSSLKKMVLKSFKQLHRTRLRVFAGDERALTAARLRINDEYNKNRNVENEEAIEALIKYGEDVERELRTQVIQAKQVKPGVFEAKITEDTVKLDNIPYNDAAIINDGINGGQPCCQDQANKN